MALSKITKVLIAGTVVVAMAGAVVAHDGSNGWWKGWGGGHMMHGWGMGGHMMGPGGPGWMFERTDGRLAFLKTELKITEKQGAAWSKLAEAVRTTGEAHKTMMQSMMEEHRSGEFFKRPLPERLAFHQTHIEARLEQIKSVSDAVDGLYEVLDAVASGGQDPRLRQQRADQGLSCRRASTQRRHRD